MSSSRTEHRLTLEEITEHVDQLPMLPAILFEIMQCDAEDENFYERIYELAKSDPSLAAFILSYANSAASFATHHIDGLKTALTRVGSQTIVDLLTTLSVARVFIPKKKEHKALWQHSIEVANIASFISRVSGSHQVPPDEAYMGGLLHDIGRFVLFQLAPSALDETDAKGWHTPQELSDVERELLGFDHAKVGYITCKKLNLPQLLINMVRYHHHYEIVEHPRAPKELQELSLIVQFADSVSVFLSQNPKWKKWSEPELIIEISNNCIHKAWLHQELPVKALVHALPMLTEKTANTCRSLGV